MSFTSGGICEDTMLPIIKSEQTLFAKSLLTSFEYVTVKFVQDDRLICQIVQRNNKDRRCLIPLNLRFVQNSLNTVHCQIRSWVNFDIHATTNVKVVRNTFKIIMNESLNKNSTFHILKKSNIFDRNIFTVIISYLDIVLNRSYTNFVERNDTHKTQI